MQADLVQKHTFTPLWLWVNGVRGSHGCRVREEGHSKCVGQRVPTVVVCTFNPGYQEAEVGVFGVQGQLGLHNESLAKKK